LTNGCPTQGGVSPAGVMIMSFIAVFMGKEINGSPPSMLPPNEYSKQVIANISHKKLEQ
jgi:hypothetical protein